MTHQPGVYVPLRALFLVLSRRCAKASSSMVLEHCRCTWIGNILSFEHYENMSVQYAAISKKR